MATYESKRYNFSGANLSSVAATAIADGSVTDSEFQFINTLASNAQTQLSARLPLAGGTMTGNTTFNDNIEARFGTSGDLRIRHDGNNSQLVDAGAGALEILTDEFKIKNAADSETMMLANENGSVALYHDNTARVTTSGTGATITGELSATGNITASGNVNGNGQNLTNINGSNISSGTVADARISTLTASKLSGPLPAIDGSALTGISNSPSAGAIGDIKPFLFMRASGSGGSTTLSAGATFTPSSYTASNMLVADYGTSVQTISISTNTQRYGALHGYAALSHASGSASGSGGTWRVIFPLISGSGSGGQGNSSYTYYYSLAGMAMRIS